MNIKLTSRHDREYPLLNFYIRTRWNNGGGKSFDAWTCKIVRKIQLNVYCFRIPVSFTVGYTMSYLIFIRLSFPLLLSLSLSLSLSLCSPVYTLSTVTRKRLNCHSRLLVIASNKFPSGNKLEILPYCLERSL